MIRTRMSSWGGVTFLSENTPGQKKAARAYALGCTVLSTDTLYSLMEQAYLAGTLFGTAPGLGDVPLTHPTPLYGENTRSTHALMDDGEPLLALIHRNGDVPCHKTALYHRGRIDPSAKADLTKLRTYPTRSIPTPGDVPRCGSCGQNIDPYSTQDLDWREHLSVSPTAPAAPVPTPEPTLTPYPGHPDLSEPGADSLLDSVESTGRTPDEEADPVDVQPSAQPDQLDSLHRLATTMFDSRIPRSWPTNPDQQPPDDRAVPSGE